MHMFFKNHAAQILLLSERLSGTEDRSVLGHATSGDYVNLITLPSLFPAQNNPRGPCRKIIPTLGPKVCKMLPTLGYLDPWGKAFLKSKILPRKQGQLREPQQLGQPIRSDFPAMSGHWD